jgi:hypothetical protein
MVDVKRVASLTLRGPILEAMARRGGINVVEWRVCDGSSAVGSSEGLPVGRIEREGARRRTRLGDEDVARAFLAMEVRDVEGSGVMRFFLGQTAPLGLGRAELRVCDWCGLASGERSLEPLEMWWCSMNHEGILEVGIEEG